MDTSDVRWLAGQVVLLVTAFLVVPLVGGAPLAIAERPPVAVPVVVGLAGVCFAGWAAVVLGRQLVPQPSPVADGVLVERGPYAVVRHPIYTGLVLLVAATALRWPGLGSLVVVVASVGFLHAKAAHEEALLEELHPGVAAYRERVRHRLLPGIL